MAKKLLVWSCVILCLVVDWSLEDDGVDMPKPVNRACIIGAGYCGLGSARFMKEYGVNFTVFEATKYVGGTWRFDPHVGTDEDGVPVFTSMYKNLRINTPRQTMEYTRFPFPEGTQSYPTGECFYNYVKSFANHFDLVKHIQFRSYITSIKWADDHWDVKYTKTDTKEDHTEQCDFVVIASGENVSPVWPNFDQQGIFTGRMIHSHDYRDAEDYRNRRVLVVGAGPSGLDLAVHLANVSAKFFHSHHYKYNEPFFSESYVKKPDVKKFTSNGVVFQDDTFEELDDVIFATGYNYSHPFLDENTGISSPGKYIMPLYQQMVNIRHPSMLFVGISKKHHLNNLREAQGEYAAALAAGKFRLPSQESMTETWNELVRSLQAIKEVNFIRIKDTDDYFEKLTKEAGIYRRAPVFSVIRDFTLKYRTEDLINYRDYDYQIVDETRTYTKLYNPRKGNPCPIV